MDKTHYGTSLDLVMNLDGEKTSTEKPQINLSCFVLLLFCNLRLLKDHFSSVMTAEMLLPKYVLGLWVFTAVAFLDHLHELITFMHS